MRIWLTLFLLVVLLLLLPGIVRGSPAPKYAVHSNYLISASQGNALVVIVPISTLPMIGNDLDFLPRADGAGIATGPVPFATGTSVVHHIWPSARSGPQVIAPPSNGNLITSNQWKRPRDADR